MAYKFANFIDAIVALRKKATTIGITTSPGICAKCYQSRPVFPVGDEKLCQTCCLDLATPKSVPITTHKIGRNEPCACGSGKKFKKCCDEQRK